jgi:hypothetical protein
LNQPVTNPSKRNKPCHFVSITPTHQLVWDESHVLKKTVLVNEPWAFSLQNDVMAAWQLMRPIIKSSDVVLI